MRFSDSKRIYWGTPSFLSLLDFIFIIFYCLRSADLVSCNSPNFCKPAISIQVPAENVKEYQVNQLFEKLPYQTIKLEASLPFSANRTRKIKIAFNILLIFEFSFSWLFSQMETFWLLAQFLSINPTGGVQALKGRVKSLDNRAQNRFNSEIKEIIESERSGYMNFKNKGTLIFQEGE